MQKRYQTILLFGAPGSGKGTQGKIIGAIPGFYHSATGDIFRTLDLQSDVGRKYWEYASRGELVPDEFTIRLWTQYMQGMELINAFHPESEFLVLDGMPRNIGQADLLRNALDVKGIIYLRAEKAKMVERLRRRALKENRFDDASDEVIERRMNVFEKETRPTLDHLQKLYPNTPVSRIDATMSQIRILSAIVEVLVPLKETLDGADGSGTPVPRPSAPPGDIAAAASILQRP